MPVSSNVRPHKSRALPAAHFQEGNLMSSAHGYLGAPRHLLLCAVLLTCTNVHSNDDTDESQANAGMQVAQLQPPRTETLPTPPPPENRRCASYSRDAVDDYATMRRFPECLKRDDPRWQSNYQNHYQWCLLQHLTRERTRQKSVRITWCDAEFARAIDCESTFRQLK